MAENYNLYADVMRSYPVLSREEERDMIARWRHDEPKLRELLVLHNLRGAISLGTTYYANILGSEETIQLAVEGLIKAAEKFDLDKDVKFLTFAVWVMRTTISNKALAPDSLVCYAAMSLDKRIKDDEDRTFGDFILRNNVSTGYKGGNVLNADDVIRAADGDDVHLIFTVIERLDCPRECKDCTREYFALAEWGFNDDGHKTLSEVARRKGVDINTVSAKVRHVIQMAREELTRKYSTEEFVCINQKRDVSKAMWSRGYHYRKVSLCSLSRRHSFAYDRIRNEGLKDVRDGKEKCRCRLKTSFHGAGFGSFYTDRYMSIARADLRDCKYSDPDVVSVEEYDEEIIESLVDETKRVNDEIEHKMKEGNRAGFTVGTLEDDGDEDYEVEVA